MQNITPKATLTTDAVPFGRSRSEVVERLGEPDCSKRGIRGDSYTDYYEDFKIEYDQALHCVAVEFSDTLILGGVDLFTLTWAELTAWFLQRDPSVQPGELIESHSMRMIATSKPPEHLEVEAVALVSEDYQWPTEAEIQAAVAYLQANTPSAAEIMKELGLEAYL